MRSLTSDDFNILQAMETEIWGSVGEAVLCPHYLRLCTEQFGDISFVALHEGRPVGYVLNIIREQKAHCATLAVHPAYRRSRVTYLLVAAMFERLLQLDVKECWFTVSPENSAARDIQTGLGAEVIDVRENYYGPGDTRLMSRIDTQKFASLRKRFGRAA